MIKTLELPRYRTSMHYPSHVHYVGGRARIFKNKRMDKRKIIKVRKFETII